jgi:hypothetical protein
MHTSGSSSRDRLPGETGSGHPERPKSDAFAPRPTQWKRNPLRRKGVSRVLRRTSGSSNRDKCPRGNMVGASRSSEFGRLWPRACTVETKPLKIGDASEMPLVNGLH